MTSGGPDGATGDTGVPPDPSSGCGASTAKPGFRSNESIMVGAAKRSYQLFVPESYDGVKVFPLVFVLHGDGGTGTGIRNSFKLEAESAGEAIIVYPDGEAKTWQIDGAAGVLKDVGFIDALAANLTTTHCTDKKRIFAVGFSKGAYFTNQLACLSKTGLRAVVTHAGGGPFGVTGSGTSFKNGQLVCPAPPVAALQVQGDADGAVPVTEGIKARDHWRRVNECKTTSTAFAPSPCIAYDGCAAGRPEIYCQIPGMGHTIWPENGTKVTWAFLKGK
jgi:polyhydroxybutyrate depolymerase